MIPAYQTVEQECYWGDDDMLVSLGPVISGAGIPSQVQSQSRYVLGQELPEITVFRADYRLQIPRLLVGSQSETVRTNPEASVALIQTDANTALVMRAIVGGIPEAAAGQGEIVANVTINPAGPVYRMTARPIEAENYNVLGGEAAVVVIAEGQGHITVDGDQLMVTEGIRQVGADVDGAFVVTIPEGFVGWVLTGPAVEV